MVLEELPVLVVADPVGHIDAAGGGGHFDADHELERLQGLAAGSELVGRGTTFLSDSGVAGNRPVGTLRVPRTASRQRKETGLHPEQLDRRTPTSCTRSTTAGFLP